jgi:hypothetical protein
MIVNLFNAVFAPKLPRGYSGRHRAPALLRSTATHRPAYQGNV